ncbi:fumarylacetoacetase [Actinoplanes lobatus]|uniref:fumarylacetoacetase n=1 Tax=Actinoplanes lobatus TaxID=113568 RepID=A0A7W7HJ68_9ACTN|nr:fumarylacetoacetase [Actinoplanes lobatus]MBB4751528.1 fumarylacetoacetase [Actinoplanes lobatus]GGN64528.1 fumarylacetoacetase [Actinoplanes lobatus]GIE41137.1 fumarylacetoacetase [Actinoplanes lobatus]
MTWLDIPAGHPFGVATLPYGVFHTAADPHPRVGVAVGDQIIDLPAACRRLAPELAGAVAGPSLDTLLAAGPRVWATLRGALTTWLSDEVYRDLLGGHLIPAGDAIMHLPFTVADYVDFYASEQHATNLGRMFRPGQDPLTPNWKHLPIGYHGRAGTVVVSGTEVVRPSGQRRSPDGEITFGPSQRLDIEAELGYVVGRPSTLGRPVGLAAFEEHVFGVCLVNDWSARDIQAWEYVPLGPFLGKSFATSISPWIVPLAALEHARVAPPARSVPLLPYLDDEKTPLWGLDIRLEVRLNGHVVARPSFAGMYWTGAQMLAHLTANGASLRTGDLYASGTISGGEPGSLIELSWNGQQPLTLPDASVRTFLADGDEVEITATAPGPAGTLIGLGTVRGRITAANSI